MCQRFTEELGRRPAKGIRMVRAASSDVIGNTMINVTASRVVPGSADNIFQRNY